MKLEWTDQAINDLTNIERLIKKANQIIKFPESGRIVPEYRDINLREIIVENYRIVYLINKAQKTISIVTIFESHYLLSNKLKKKLLL